MVLTCFHLLYVKYAGFLLWPEHHAWAGDEHLNTLPFQKQFLVWAGTEWAKLCRVEHLLIRLIRQMSSSHLSTLAPLSAADGIASECWLNMPWLCPGNATDTHLLKMGRISSKIGEDLCQRTLKTLLCIQRRMCVPVNPETSSKWHHRNSYTLGWSASPLQEYMFFSLQGSPSSLANTHSPQALTLEFLNKGKQKLNP